MRGIFTVTVENKAGVLSKISGLFARRGFNIDSLAVGETDEKDISSMTIISTGDERIMEQIEKQLNKMIDVIKVRRFSEKKVVTRELLMIKVNYTNVTRADITLLYFGALLITAFLFVLKFRIGKPQLRGILVMVAVGAVEFILLLLIHLFRLRH